MNRRYKGFPYTLPPDSSPTTTIPHQMVHLFQTMNLHGHIIIQSPQLTSRVTLDAVHSMGLNKCMMTCIHHNTIIQSSVTVLRNLWAPLVHPSKAFSIIRINFLEQILRSRITIRSVSNHHVKSFNIFIMWYCPKKQIMYQSLEMTLSFWRSYAPP